MRPFLRGIDVSGHDGGGFRAAAHDIVAGLRAEVAALVDEGLDLGTVEEKFVEPSDLGEHLEVGDVLRGEGPST